MSPAGLPGPGEGGREAPFPPNANEPGDASPCPPCRAAPHAGPGRIPAAPRGLRGGWRRIVRDEPRRTLTLPGHRPERSARGTPGNRSASGMRLGSDCAGGRRGWAGAVSGCARAGGVLWGGVTVCRYRGCSLGPCLCVPVPGLFFGAVSVCACTGSVLWGGGVCVCRHRECSVPAHPLPL